MLSHWRANHYIQHQVCYRLNCRGCQSSWSTVRASDAILLNRRIIFSHMSRIWEFTEAGNLINVCIPGVHRHGYCDKTNSHRWIPLTSYWTYCGFTEDLRRLNSVLVSGNVVCGTDHLNATISHWGQLTHICVINTLRSRLNDRHVSDDIFKCIFLNGNVWTSLTIWLKFVPKNRINNIPALVQKMTWRRPGEKSLTEPMMVYSTDAYMRH